MSKKEKKIVEIQENTDKKRGTAMFPFFNLAIFSVGFIMLLIGLVLLSEVNSDSSNMPGIVSPIAILTAVLVIIISLLVKDNEDKI